ncbi:hypothetical protein F442_18889, partial [Phytophthora nicotianae P10297]
YGMDNEEVPYIAVPNVNHIVMVIVLVAAGRPRYDMEQLVAALVSAYLELDSVALSKCLLTLHSVIEQAMLNRGGNEYKVPHLGKDKWLCIGDLPLSLPCSSEIANAAFDEVIV